MEMGFLTGIHFNKVGVLRKDDFSLDFPANP